MLADFLTKKISLADAKAALKLVRLFKECESKEEWLLVPFDCWIKFEQLEEYLAFLAEGEELRPDTKAWLKNNGRKMPRRLTK